MPTLYKDMIFSRKKDYISELLNHISPVNQNQSKIAVKNLAKYIVCAYKNGELTENHFEELLEYLLSNHMELSINNKLNWKIVDMQDKVDQIELKFNKKHPLQFFPY